MNLSKMKINQLFAATMILGMMISLTFSSQAQAAERYWIAQSAAQCAGGGDNSK